MYGSRQKSGESSILGERQGILITFEARRQMSIKERAREKLAEYI